MSIKLRKLPDASFGAIVEGLEPSEPPTEEIVAEVRAALAEHVLLVVRGHRPPSDAELVRFAGGFGPLFDGGELFGIASPTREILRLTSERNELGVETGPSSATPLPWHTDYSYLPCAARETFLEAVQLPADGGGRTWFADVYDAWESLAETIHDRLDGLVGIHSIKGSGRHLNRDERRAARAGREVKNPDFTYPGGRVPARHPLAHRHPDTGRIALYVNSLVAGIEGWDPDDADSLIEDLIVHATDEGRVYGHAWEVGDLVIFDDIGTIHRRDPSDRDQIRTMRQLSTMLTDDGLAGAASVTVSTVGGAGPG